MNALREILAWHVFPCDPICDDQGCRDCGVMEQIIAWRDLRTAQVREAMLEILSSGHREIAAWHREEMKRYGKEVRELCARRIERMGDQKDPVLKEAAVWVRLTVLPPIEEKP